MRPHHVLLLVGLVLAAACSDGGGTVTPPTGGGGGFPDTGGSGGGGGDGCDLDGDGQSSTLCGGEDCDDGDDRVYTGASERCDGLDSNCNGTVDEGCECNAGDLRACWTGAEAKRGVGACADGVQRCSDEGTWGDCAGEVDPVEEGPACDGVDQDCDGKVDGPGCGSCPGGGLEICGNGLDDDCSGTIDDPATCTLDCSSVNPRDPGSGSLTCCVGPPPPAFGFSCVDYGDLAPCTSTERECLDLDGDEATVCTKRCNATSCSCGRADDMGNIVAVADCGFLTPCARIDCDGRQNQPCYSGPPGTLGVGVCHGGRHSCRGEAGSRAWGSCEGEVTPDAEICGNDLDDDCDGLTDENDGATGKACAVRPDCEMSAPELCENGLDDDCDGFADEGCAAPAGGSQACWTGALLNRGVGACKDGEQQEVAGRWGPCVGQTLPGGEACGDEVDSDCNGLGSTGVEEDPFCCVAGKETCNGLDDDCDGLADEGLLTRCGTCGGTCNVWELTDSSCTGPGRSCRNVGPSPLDSSSITLVPGRPAGFADKVFVTSWGGGGSSDLYVIDAATAVAGPAIDLEFNANQVAASPDGTVWLGSFSGTGGGDLEHRDALGRRLCRAELGAIYAINPDSSGDAWVVTVAGTGFTYVLDRVSGRDTIPGPDGVPVCRIFDISPADPDQTGITVSGYPTVEDANHQLWIMPGFNGTLQRIDLLKTPLTLENLDLSFTAGASSGTIMGPDGGIYVGFPLRRIDTAGPFDGTAAAVRNLADGASISSFGFAPDGTIWGIRSSGGSADFVHLTTPTGDEIGSADVGSGSGFGLALDGYGRIWHSTFSGGGGSQLRRFDPVTGESEPVLTGFFQLSEGSTSAAVLDAGRRQGSWKQVIDGGAFSVRWGQLSWTSYAPANTRVAALVRFADSEESLDSSPLVCGPFASSPADITACSGGRRWARLEFELSGYGQPAVGQVKLTWDRR